MSSHSKLFLFKRVSLLWLFAVIQAVEQIDVWLRSWCLWKWRRAQAARQTTSCVLATRTAIPSYAACVYGTSQWAVLDVSWSPDCRWNAHRDLCPSSQLFLAFTMVCHLFWFDFFHFCGSFHTKGCWLTSPFGRICCTRQSDLQGTDLCAGTCERTGNSRVANCWADPGAFRAWTDWRADRRHSCSCSCSSDRGRDRRGVNSWAASSASSSDHRLDEFTNMFDSCMALCKDGPPLMEPPLIEPPLNDGVWTGFCETPSTNTRYTPLRGIMENAVCIWLAGDSFDAHGWSDGMKICKAGSLMWVLRCRHRLPHSGAPCGWRLRRFALPRLMRHVCWIICRNLRLCYSRGSATLTFAWPNSRRFFERTTKKWPRQPHIRWGWSGCSISRNFFLASNASATPKCCSSQVFSLRNPQELLPDHMICNVNIRKNMCANVVLLGGTACFKVTGDRMLKELTALAPLTRKFMWLLHQTDDHVRQEI